MTSRIVLESRVPSVSALYSPRIEATINFGGSGNG